MFPAREKVLPFGDFHDYSHHAALQPGKPVPANKLEFLRTGKDSNCTVICGGKAFNAHIHILNKCKTLSHKIEFKTPTRKLGTITLNGFESFECHWVLQYLYQDNRIDITKATAQNPSKSMLDTAFRLHQIATTLHPSQLAAYATEVFSDYSKLIYTHFMEASDENVIMGQGDVAWYAREMDLVISGALTKEDMSEDADAMLTGVIYKCLFCTEVEVVGSSLLLNMVERLCEEVPRFRKRWDRILARPGRGR